MIPLAGGGRFLAPAELAQHIGTIRMGLHESGIERGGRPAGGERRVEVALVLERIAEIGMGLRDFRRQGDRLPRRGNRRLGIAARTMNRCEIGEGFIIIRFDGKRLLDQPCRRRVLAPRMRDQPEMMEANEMTDLVREDCRIGRLRLRITPGAKIFERVREHLRARELARDLSVIEPALASRRCHRPTLGG